MANERSFDNVEAPESAVKVVTGGFTTNSTGNPDAPVGIVSSVANSSPGEFTVTLKEKYASLLAHSLQVINSAGTQLQLESEDIGAGSLVMQLLDTDGAAVDTTDEVCTIMLLCKNDKLPYR